MSYDTIIIGAGLSGLAAGIRLAYYDKKVCIVEKHYTIGGLNSFYRLRGRDHDAEIESLIFDIYRKDFLNFGFQSWEP